MRPPRRLLATPPFPHASELPPAEALRADRPLRTLLFLYRDSRGTLALALFFFLIKHSPVWALPLLTANIIDAVADPARHPISTLWVNGGLLVVLTVQNVPTHYLHVRFLSRALRRTEALLRGALVLRLQYLSIPYYTRASTGALQAKLLRDVEVIDQTSRYVFQQVPALVVSFVVALAVTAVRAPWFVPVFLGAAPIAALLVRRLRGPLRQHNRRYRRQVERLSARLVEMIRLIPITRAHGLERDEVARVRSDLRAVHDRGFELDGTTALFQASSWAAFSLFNVLCLLGAAWAVYTGALPLSVGDVVLLTGYFGTLIEAVRQLTTLLPEITRGYESIRSVGELLQEGEVEENEGKAPVGGVEGRFTFEAVSYGYEGEAHAVEDLSLEVAPGETVAIVGPSGAGKSTVLKLVMGFVRPTSGRLLLDGRDMAALDLRTYRRHLAVVPQELVLFDGTVRDNVLYGAPPGAERRFEDALRDADALEFVAALPEGPRTVVGENGAALSGGQKQRLAIARALIRDPRVLLLDEPTSALDVEAEREIQEALARLMRGRTTFVVAHRLSTIRTASRIVVMEAGRIAEVGPHEALLAADGAYARLWRSQAA